MIADLTKDCIKGIQLLENKRSDLRKLLQLKLIFSLEEIISFAKLAYEIECLGETKGSNPICLTVFKCCAKYIQIVLNDSNIQVNRYLCMYIYMAVYCFVMSKDM